MYQLHLFSSPSPQHPNLPFLSLHNHCASGVPFLPFSLGKSYLYSRSSSNVPCEAFIKFRYSVFCAPLGLCRSFYHDAKLYCDYFRTYFSIGSSHWMASVMRKGTTCLIFSYQAPRIIPVFKR